MSNVEANIRPEYDKIIQNITEYIFHYEINSELAFDTARYCLMDSIGCGILALNFSECTKLLGPVVDGTIVPNGSRVPGTNYCLDPVKAAWDIGCIIRWLDFNDTWLASEWGHPSDNLGSILAIADHLSQINKSKGKDEIEIKKVFECIIKAHEIQGVLALENSFNKVGLDHVLLVKIASTGLVCFLMGGNEEQVKSAISHALVDGQPLRTYRHAPNTSSRKSWAAGDACARSILLSKISMSGEMGIPGVLTAEKWGFYDVLFGGNEFELNQEFGSYVMENVLFKISFPAEFHAQTACEAAITLHKEIKDRINEIERIEIKTHESAIRIISKEGPLNNPADRDHCIQYIVAVSLLYGNLISEYYEDDFHQNNPLIDELRSKIIIKEDKTFSKDYLDPNKRSIANAIQIFFNNGESTKYTEVAYPIGHRLRRTEGIPLLIDKFRTNIKTRFSESESEKILNLFLDKNLLEKTKVSEFMQMLAVNKPSQN